jgi:hypothetical protein
MYLSIVFYQLYCRVGEAMSCDYRGTIHGAYITGQSAAKDIIDIIV